MKALVFNKGLRYQTDYPMPVPKPDEALIRVTHSGICNTDLEIIRGYMGFHGIPGHEFVGVIERCGDMNIVGKRVTGEINIGCGKCFYCKGKMHNHCPDRSVLGILNKDGVFAEYVTLPVNNLHLIPDQVLDEEAVFIEPLAAAFEILQQVEVRPSDRVCVLGDGKLGLLVGQVLSTTNCDLVVMGKHQEKLSILDKTGIRTELIPDDKAYISDGSVLKMDVDRSLFDIVIDCSGSPTGIMMAIRIVKPMGKIVLKTTTAERVPLDINQLVIKEITLIGSRCGPFLPAIDAIKNKEIILSPLVSKISSLNSGKEAFEDALKKGALKIILKND